MFLVIGALWLIVGALAFPLHRRGGNAQYIFVSERADEAFFGRSAGELLAADPAFDRFRTMMIAITSGFLELAGATYILVAWFWLRSGSGWALVTLSVGIALALVLWVAALIPYRRAGVRLTLADVPPFIWLPGVLLVPAVTLGWLGLG